MSQLDIVVDQIKRLPPNELVRLIRQTAEILEQKQNAARPTNIDYVALIGSGRGSFASPAEADRFIREERDAWEK